MLASAPLPPVNLPQQRLQLSWKPPNTCFPFDNSRSSHLHFRVFISSKISRAFVRAGYTRIPLDTPGAYQLIDDENGEKVIVWGDDSSSSVPSKDVLSWNPSQDRDNHHHDTSSSSRNDDNEGTEFLAPVSSRISRKAPSIGNFGRLKTQRVRGLARKVSRTEQEKFKHDENLLVNNAPPYRSKASDSGLENTWKKKKIDAPGNGKGISQPSQSQVRRDIFVQKPRMGKDMGHFRGTVEHTEQIQQYHVPPANALKYENKIDELDVSVPKSSALHLSRWGNGEIMQSFRTETTDSPKRSHKSSADGDFFSRKSFRDLGCCDYMIESLRGQSFLRPSRIQAMSFSPVVDGKSCIISDQSGSGKTLAYLVPVIQRLRQEELQGVSKSSSQSPRVVILAPTAELASQVLSNCRSMSKNGVPFRSMVVTGGFRQKTQLESLQQDLDVLIATPGRFMYLIKEGFLQLTNIRCAVLDEVDILFSDEDFGLVLQTLINSSPVTTQYLFVTATLPIDAYNKLVEAFPDCEMIMGPGMHRISPGLEEVLVDCSGDDREEKNPETAFLNKKSALLQLVEGNPVSKTIIFCNKIETCRKVENILNRCDRKENYMRVLSFHAALTQESRIANMKEFLNPRSEKDSLYLICTDRASRGIDFAGVDHVILFDFPRDPSEYVRRVGRTARGAGGKGRAFVFVVGKQVSLARRIMERNQKGRPLHDVPSMYSY